MNKFYFFDNLTLAATTASEQNISTSIYGNPTEDNCIKLNSTKSVGMCFFCHNDLEFKICLMRICPVVLIGVSIGSRV